MHCSHNHCLSLCRAPDLGDLLDDSWQPHESEIIAAHSYTGTQERRKLGVERVRCTPQDHPPDRFYNRGLNLELLISQTRPPTHVLAQAPGRAIVCPALVRIN